MRATLLIGAICAAFSFQAQAIGHLADVQIYDRKDNHQLAIYEHHGRYYVAGEPGREYSIRLDNRSGGRVLAVTSVDGVNVVSGETATPNQTGYVLDTYSGMDIAGWRKSMERTAAFFFTRLKNSYAARTGRPNDVGVIGVALFRERYHPEPEACCPPPRPYSPSAGAAREESAASPPSANQDAHAPQRQEKKLGTGHGRSEHSVVSYTDFERASSTPDEVIAIYYDSYKNLQAQGIVPAHHFYSDRRPDAFPGRFVADP